jgi:hypothetical protein
MYVHWSHTDLGMGKGYWFPLFSRCLRYYYYYYNWKVSIRKTKAEIGSHYCNLLAVTINLIFINLRLIKGLPVITVTLQQCRWASSPRLYGLLPSSMLCALKNKNVIGISSSRGLKWTWLQLNIPKLVGLEIVLCLIQEINMYLRDKYIHNIWKSEYIFGFCHIYPQRLI